MDQNSSTPVLSTFSITGDNLFVEGIKSQGLMIFSGVAAEESFTNLTLTEDNKTDLLIRAINNRTRERNYFKLLSSLLENEITEEEFDQEIDQNEDEYVVSTDQKVDLNSLKFILSNYKRIKDVNDMDDLSALFSLDKKLLNRIIEKSKRRIS